MLFCVDVLDWHDIRMLPYYTFFDCLHCLKAIFSNLPRILEYIHLGKRDVFPLCLALLACSKPPYFDGCGRQKRPRERRRT